MSIKKKKSIVDSLSLSITEESKAVDKRFEKADQFFNQDKKIEKPEEKPQEIKTKAGEGRVKIALQPKPKKAAEAEKVIRDGFSMPVSDQQLIQDIRVKGIKLGVESNKSEIVRAGLRALMDLPDNKLTSLLKTIPKIKTGRPVDK